MAGDKEHPEEPVEYFCEVPDCGEISYETFAYKFHRMWHKKHGKGVKDRWTQLHPESDEIKQSPEKITKEPVQEPPASAKSKESAKKKKKITTEKVTEEPIQEPQSSTKQTESAKKKKKLTTKPGVVQIKEENDEDCVILEQDTKDIRTSTPIHKTAPSTSKPTKGTRKSKDPQATSSAELPSPIVPPPPSEPDAEETCRRKRVDEKNTTNSDPSCKSENGNVSKTPKLDHSHTNSSSSSSKADIETSTLPLSVAIFARARQFPAEIMIIWCNSLEDDLLGAICHNPSHSMLCVQNLNAIQIPDSQRDMLKNCNIINFNMADSNYLFTPWTVVSFMNIIPMGLKNKIFRNFADVEKEFTNFASMNVMGLSNIIRYTRVGFFPDLSRQLSTKILAFNCPSEQFVKK